MGYNKNYNKYKAEGLIKNKEIPLLPISAHGESLTRFFSIIETLQYEKIISPVASAEFAITVAGDSMAPEYPCGSHIFIRKINEQAFIEWGKIYVLDTCNGLIIKKIMPSECNYQNKVRCVSINPEYPPFEISLSDVHGIYSVVLCMSIK